MNLGFHFDLSDQTKTIPDTRPGAAEGATRKVHIFKWQAASQAQRASIVAWMREHGSHAEIATVEIPEDASEEEIIEILDNTAAKV